MPLNLDLKSFDMDGSSYDCFVTLFHSGVFDKRGLKKPVAPAVDAIVCAGGRCGITVL